VTRVQIVDPEEKRLEVIVEDTQLSLAIGKKGQNVRLASKLIGWNIDIKSEEEKRREIEAQMAALTAPGTPLTQLAGVGPKTIEKLEAHGVTSIEKLADMTPEQLVEIPGIGEKMVEKIHQSVALYFEELEAQAAAGGEASAAEPEVAAEGAAVIEEATEAEAGAGDSSESAGSVEAAEDSETAEGTEVREAESVEDAEAGATESIEAGERKATGGEQTESDSEGEAEKSAGSD
jgi:N utilization substance protein A